MSRGTVPTGTIVAWIRDDGIICIGITSTWITSAWISAFGILTNLREIEDWRRFEQLLRWFHGLVSVRIQPTMFDPMNVTGLFEWFSVRFFVFAATAFGNSAFVFKSGEQIFAGLDAFGAHGHYASLKMKFSMIDHFSLF